MRKLLSKIAEGAAVAKHYKKLSDIMVLPDGGARNVLDNTGNNIVLASDEAREMSELECMVRLTVREQHDDGTVGEVKYDMTKGDAEEVLKAQRLVDSQQRKPKP